MRRARISTIRLDEGATLFVRGHFSLFYNCDIVVFPGGKLQFGSGYINSDLKLRCADRITIGDDVAISHDVTILDSDHHALGGKPIATSPVSIGNHVWIGTRATILQGVEIGGGCIVAAGAVVTKSMPPNSLIAGVPAKVIKENISWE